jgi:uncharacterized protein YndB with AHSA1/START domain
MENEPVVVERVFDVPSGRVWGAITDKDQMRIWYFNIVSFKPFPGFEFQFEGGSPQKTYTHLCKVTEVEEGRKIAYSWKYRDYPGASLVNFELFPEGSRTRLRLTHSHVESFPQDIPDFARSNFEMGWTEIIGNSLKKYLETRTQPATT